MTGGLRGGRSGGSAPAAGGPVPGSGSSGSRAGHRRPDPWRTAFFGVLILGILGGAAWALLGSSLLVVRHEEVTGSNRLVPAAEVLAAAGIRRGTSMASLDTAAVARRVEQITQVLSATVSRSWPDTVVIAIRERTPVLAAPSGRGYALIDRFGVTVEWSRHRPAGMPLISPAPTADGGSQGIQAAATVLRQLPEGLRKRVVSVSAPSAGAVTLRLRGGVTVVWGSPDQGQAKAAELIVLLRTKARYYDVSDPATAVTQG
jgi:cell division protein FtsQ